MEPFLDLRSFARRGPGRRDHFSPAEVALIARTVRRAPEVIMKVSGGATSVKGAIAHLKYIDRGGKLELESDDGMGVKGKGAERALAEEWQLGLDEAEAQDPARATPGRRPTKLTQNLVLSMPAGTPPEGLLAAAKSFAREEFALKHSYALVLHTDQDHPHVHLVVRSMGEDGRRLRIRRDTLRRWRSAFVISRRNRAIRFSAYRGQLVFGILEPVLS